MLMAISFIGLVISFTILCLSSGEGVRGKGANIKVQIIAIFFTLLFTALFARAIAQKVDRQARQDEYTSVTISDKQGNLRHSYSGNIHYEGEDRLKIIDKEGNTIYYTIGDDEIFYGVH